MLLAPDVERDWESDTLQEYIDDINNICQCLEDPWSAHADSAHGHEHSIIQAPPEKAALYLQNIDMLWQLGISPKTAGA